jgi:hypothetical protein
MTAIRWFDDVGIGDLAEVGGKNASLGELRRNLAGAGVRVPNGFALTAAAYEEFIESNGLAEPIRALLSGWDRHQVADLVRRSATIRDLIKSGGLSPQGRFRVLGGAGGPHNRFHHRGCGGHRGFDHRRASTRQEGNRVLTSPPFTDHQASAVGSPP